MDGYDFLQKIVSKKDCSEKPDLQGNAIKKRIQINECVFNFIKSKMTNWNYFMLAFKYSLFKRAMFSREIPFGHSTSQAPVLVQFPNPSSSI